MSYIYFIQSELVIEYKAFNGRINTIYTNRKISKSKRKFSSTDFSNIDDNSTTMEDKIQHNTYNKILYSNGNWSKELYKNVYENMLKQTYNEIDVILKVYIKHVEI